MSEGVDADADVDFAALNIAQLNKIISKAEAEKHKRLTSKKKTNLESALIPVELPSFIESVTKASDKKKFVQYFTRQTVPGSKWKTADFYAKSRSGLLYKWHNSNREWNRVEG